MRVGPLSDCSVFCLCAPGLEELDLSRQQPASLESQRELAETMNAAEPGRFVDAGGMIFDMASIATIARSLRILELADNGITTVAHFCYLGGLQELVLSNNAIADKQDLAQMLSGYQFLQKLDLSGNPVAEPKPAAAGAGGRGGGRSGVGPSYRDEVVLMSSTLSVLDGKEITMQQRRFLEDREAMRQRRRQAKAAARAGGPGGGGGGAAGGGGAKGDAAALEGMGMGMGMGKENDGDGGNAGGVPPGTSVGLSV